MKRAGWGGFAVKTLCGLLIPSVLLPAALLFGAAAVRGAEEPEKPAGAFARGERLPGDLSDLLDGDADGKVTDGEAQKAAREFMEQANAKEKTERGAKILEALDKDKNGKVEEAEAQGAVAVERANRAGPGQEVAGIFDQLDVNRDDYVTAQEFGALVKQLGPLGILLQPRLAEIFNGMDTNRDGAISFVEAQMGAEDFADQMAARQAAEEAKPDPRIVQLTNSVIGQLDRNRDGKLSKREAERDKNVAEKFFEVDANLDEQLTAEEIYNYLKKTLPQQ